MIKLSKFVLVSVLCFGFLLDLTAEDESNLKASVNAGYTSNYVVNGLAKTDSQVFGGFDIQTQYYNIDTYVGAVVLDAGSGLDELHANVGLGKSFFIYDSFSLRADAQLFQHQVDRGQNSTESRFTLALDNKYVTPYVIASYDIDVSNLGAEQQGYIVGLKKSVNVFDLFYLTPSVEYGMFTDYETMSAKIDASKTLFRHVELFGQVGWFDNDFDVVNYNFAVQEFDGDVAASAGVRWKF